MLWRELRPLGPKLAPARVFHEEPSARLNGSTHPTDARMIPELGADAKGTITRSSVRELASEPAIHGVGEHDLATERAKAPSMRRSTGATRSWPR